MGLTNQNGTPIFSPGEYREMMLRNALAQTQATTKDPDVLSSAVRNAERNRKDHHDNQD